MNFRILNYFLTVARERSITKAADILHITQPTLSRQLMQLEAELGVILIDRTQHRFALTPAGSFLAQRAKDIIELVEKTAGDIKDQETNLSGNICIGAGEINSVHLLADLLQAFQQKYPQVTFDIFTATSDIIYQKTEKGLLDIALVMEPVDMVNYGFLKFPVKEQLGVVVRKDSPLAAKKSICAADLEDKQLLLPSRLQINSLILNWLSGNISRIRLIGTCNLLHNSYIIVEHFNCCAIVDQLDSMDESKLAFRPLEPPVEIQTYLIWRSSSAPSAATKKFIEFAKCFLSIKGNTK